MKLTTHAIDQLAHQSPCLCGDLETWHPTCYHGLSDAQIADRYKMVYREAAKAFRLQVKLTAKAAIDAAMK